MKGKRERKNLILKSQGFNKDALDVFPALFLSKKFGNFFKKYICTTYQLQFLKICQVIQAFAAK